MRGHTSNVALYGLSCGNHAERLLIRAGYDFTGPDVLLREIEPIFDVLDNQVPDIAKVVEVQHLRSDWSNGVKRLSVSYRG